jgi:hypothetical protein
LAWATLFAANIPDNRRLLVLTGLALLSLLLSVVYGLFGWVATKFVAMHYDLSLTLEGYLEDPRLYTAHHIVALQHGEKYVRTAHYNAGKHIQVPIPWLLTRGTRGGMLVFVPCAFAVLSFMLCWISVSDLLRCVQAG